jgi:hypothetical protein
VNGGGFFLGTYQPGWRARLEVPLFVSHRTLRSRRTLPRARVRWALDFGGFTELSLYGGWQTTPAAYAEAVARYAAGVGQLAWASAQDWMCEPCESMIECVRRSSRNVKHWQSGDMAPRWTAAGMLEAERQFRRIIGYRDLAKLAVAVEHEVTPPQPTTYDRAGRCRHHQLTVTLGPSPKFHGTRDILAEIPLPAKPR